MNTRKLVIFITGLALIALSCRLPSITAESTPTPTPPAPTLIPEPVINLPSTAGELAFASERDGRWQVLVMNADGSGETSLTTPYGNYSYPDWSPDGNRLAMRIDYSDDPGVSCDNGIAVMDVSLQNGQLAGSQPLELTCAFSDAPDWSPDGSQLLYILSGVAGWDFFRYDLAGNAATPIQGLSRWGRDPKWSPDGTKILFSADVENIGNSDIFLANLDGSGLTQLTWNPDFDGYPAWSPDGTKIVFTSKVNDNQDLYIMNIDGSGLTRLTSSPGDEFDPSWSPDGERIAFVTSRHIRNDSNYEIYLINADGSAEMRLTNNSFIDRWPVWRPGSTVSGQAACSSTTAFVADITIPAGTQFISPTSFTKVWQLENTGTCTWTPDAFRLRFVEGDLMGGPVASYVPGAVQPTATVALALPLTAPSSPGAYRGTWQLWDAAGNPVPDSTGRPLTLTVSIEVLPQGGSILPAPLYYLVGEGAARQLWRMETDGRASPVTSEPAGVQAFDVSPVDGRVAYISAQQLLLVDTGGAGRQVLVTAGQDESLSSPLWSPDGARLAYGSNGIHVITPASGEDRLILENNPSLYASQFRRYSPLYWSPDGNKMAVFIGYYEWLGLGILSLSDGDLLSEFNYAEMLSWSQDSQILFMARLYWMGMNSQLPGLSSIAASPNATPLELLPETPVWYPHQRADGRLLYWMGAPDSDDLAATMPISLYASLPDGLSERQVLRSNLLWLAEGEFLSGLWTPDGSHFIAGLSHATSQVNEVLYLSAAEQPLIFLLQEGYDFRWGK